MTTRRFNYTRLKRIKQSHVLVSVSPSAPFTADVAIELDEYELPNDARIVVEAYADWTLMRFPFGTVARAGASSPLELIEFDAPEGIRFRIKVLGNGELAGRILAEADGVSTVDEETSREGQSFLRVRPEDLGAQVWRLSFDESQPILSISSKLEDWRSTVRSSAFRALVLPEVFRQLLDSALEEGEDSERPGWVSDCINLGRTLCGGEPPLEDEDLRHDWVEKAVNAMCKANSLLDEVTTVLEAPGE